MTSPFTYLAGTPRRLRWSAQRHMHRQLAALRAQGVRATAEVRPAPRGGWNVVITTTP